MNWLKYLTLSCASVMLLASCTIDLGGDDEDYGDGNDDYYDSPEMPVEVEPLPDGVQISGETVQLNNLQLEYVIETNEDNSEIIFSSDLPKEHIPNKGQIILQFKPTDRLPFGFLGRVTSVINKDNTIVVKTEAPTLAEAFDEFVVDSNAEYIMSKSRSAAEMDYDYYVDENNFICYSRTFMLDEPEVTCELELGVNVDLNEGYDYLDDQWYNISLNTTANVGYKYAFLDAYDDSVDLDEVIIFRVPNVAPAMMGKVQFSWIAQSSGEAQVVGMVSTSTSRSYRVIKQGKEVYTEGEELKDSQMDVKFKKEFALEGEAFAGLGMSVDLCWFGRKELSVGIEANYGSRVSGDVNLLTTDSNDWYEQYKDSAVEVEGVTSATAYAQSALLNVDNERLGYIDDENVFYEATRYVFPSFTEMNATLSSADEVTCEVNYDRDLLFESGVGMAQYLGDEMIYMSSPIYYYNADDLEYNGWSVTFGHQSGADYWTYVKWDDSVVRCKQYSLQSQDGDTPDQGDDPDQGSGGDEWDASLLVGTWELVQGYSGAQYMIFSGDGTGLMYISADDQVGFEWTLSGSDLTIADYEGDTTTAQVIQLTSTGLVVRGLYDNGESGTLTYEKVAD